MTGVEHNKLIRDNIPEIIEARGKTAVVRTLSDEEYVHYLKRKLQEEVDEYIENSCIEELCDIYEVLDALKKALRYADDDIESVKSKKAIKNGKFDKKLLLERVL